MLTDKLTASRRFAACCLIGVASAYAHAAHALDIWRLESLSHRGEPFKARAPIQLDPGEKISAQCVSLGNEGHAPGLQFPLLRDARLSVSSNGDAIELTTDRSVTESAISIVLRVACPGTDYYVRVFNIVLLKPPSAKAQPALSAQPRVPGSVISLRAGDTIETIARGIYPSNEQARRDLVGAIVSANPHAFPDGQLKPVPQGTPLRIPDLLRMNKIESAAVKSQPPSPVPAPRPAAVSKPPSQRPKVPPPGESEAKQQPAPALAAAQARTSETVPAVPTTTPKPGTGPIVTSCQELRRRCAEVSMGAVGTPGIPPPAQFVALETRLADVQRAQSLNDIALTQLEAAVRILRSSVDALPSGSRTAPQARPAPVPRVPPSTPILAAPAEKSWLPWIVVAAISTGLSAATFLIGLRVGSQSNGGTLLSHLRAGVQFLSGAPGKDAKGRRIEQLDEHDVALGASTATRTTMGSRQKLSAATVRDAAPAIDTTASTASDVDTRLRQEMDAALNRATSVFTDVDRFVALGRMQNAIGLLNEEIKTNPDRQEVWIKLLAIYRSENMEAELQHTLEQFRQRFPAEN